MTAYFLSIDQGTTSSRAIIFNHLGKMISCAQQEFKQIFPQEAWVEHDPEEIWQTVISTCHMVLTQAKLTAADITSIGITNQRETTLIWDKTSNKCIYNAIVWQDRRTTATCQTLAKDKKLVDSISAKTGLLLDPYFSATKIAWLLRHVDGAQALAEAGQLRFGTIDSFLLWRLTGGKVHATDATNASRTMLYNIHTNQWDNELLQAFNIPRALLPQVKDCAADYGKTTEQLFSAPIAINAIAGDQQAALIGQGCLTKGMLKSTYGTGCFMMMNTGNLALKSNNKLLTTIAYRLNGETTYAIEGSIFMAGASIQWIRDGLQLIDHANESQTLAENTDINNNVYMVPAFTGLGAPYWDPDARGAILGLTRNTGIKEIVTAALQAVCYQSRDLITAMIDDGAKPNCLRVDGGMVNNNWLVQYLSDILSLPVERPQMNESTALGVAYLAAVQTGVIKSLSQCHNKVTTNQVFTPKLAENIREKNYSGWLDAVAKIRYSQTDNSG